MVTLVGELLPLSFWAATVGGIAIITIDNTAGPNNVLHVSVLDINNISLGHSRRPEDNHGHDRPPEPVHQNGLTRTDQPGPDESFDSTSDSGRRGQSRSAAANRTYSSSRM